MALPITFYASSIAYVVGILSLTSYRPFSTRVILWTVIATSNAIAVANAKNFTPDMFYNWWWTLLSIQQTLFMGFLYRLDRANLVIPEQLPYHQRVLHAWAIFWNYRGIGTPWQISYIPPERVLGFQVERPTTRRRFLKIRTFNFLVMFLALCVWTDPLLAPQFRPEDFAADKEPFFRRINQVTLREFMFRTWITFQHVIPSWLTFSLVHTSISISAVLLGGRPEEWPPLFGSIFEAYSVRRYWRYFWHPIIRRSFTSTGSLLLEHVAGIDTETQLHRTSNTFVVFFLSSLMHYAAESHWINWKEGQVTLWWWSLQAPIILVEELVQPIYSENKPRLEKALGVRIGHGWERLFGHAWLLFFWFWSVPRLEYAKHRPLWEAILSE